MTLLFLFVILLLPLHAQAEVDFSWYTYTDCVVNTKDPKAKDVCKVTRTELTPNPCLAMMERAMRAMETYIGQPFNFEDWTPYALTKLDEANKQWEDAAKRCWTK